MTPQTDVALAGRTTIGVGGAARWFVEAHTEGEVAAALQWAREREIPAWILGGGSNVVIADEGVAGLVVHVQIKGVEVRRLDRSTFYMAAAGEPWDAFVAASVAAGDGGLECLSGIPGLVGGTPVQNVGAYGQEVSGTITRVRVVSRATGRVTELSNAECQFGYRSSRFKGADAGRYVVTHVEFELVPGGAPTVTYADVTRYFAERAISGPTLDEVRHAVMAIRGRKGMVIEPGNPANRSCGSFFVNPVVDVAHFRRLEARHPSEAVPHYAVEGGVKIPAAWLIERAGWPKGRRRGPVGVSPFQSQAIVNHGGAMAADVLALAVDIKRAVWEAFDIVLVPEPVFIGFAESAALDWLLSSAAAPGPRDGLRG